MGLRQMPMYSINEVHEGSQWPSSPPIRSVTSAGRATNFDRQSQWRSVGVDEPIKVECEQVKGGPRFAIALVDPTAPDPLGRAGGSSGPPPAGTAR
jgi:hypothetical protein